MKVTTILKALGLATVAAHIKPENDTEITSEDLAKKLGIELAPVSKTDDGDTETATTLTDTELAALPEGIRKSVKAMQDKHAELEKTVDEIISDREAIEKQSIESRVQALNKRAGTDYQADDVTSESLTLLEKMADRHDAVIRKLGVFDLQGHARETEGGAMAEVRKAVREHLGREPRDQGEAAAAKRAIFKSNKGLLRAVLLEEKARRAANQ